MLEKDALIPKQEYFLVTNKQEKPVNKITVLSVTEDFINYYFTDEFNKYYSSRTTSLGDTDFFFKTQKEADIFYETLLKPRTIQKYQKDLQTWEDFLKYCINHTMTEQQEKAKLSNEENLKYLVLLHAIKKHHMEDKK